MSPDVLFAKFIDGFIGDNLHSFRVYADNAILRFIRNYFLDMLRGYALVFALFLVFGNDTAKLKRIFIIASIFTIAIEFLQSSSVVGGTFDIWDIVAMLLSQMLAVFVIKYEGKGYGCY